VSIIIDEKGETYKSDLIQNLPDFEENRVISEQENNPKKWIRPKIDKNILKDLREKRTMPGIIYIVEYFSLLLICGYMAYITWGTYWSILWFWIYGTIYSFSGACEHECRHRTFFKQRILNDIFQYILSIMTYRETEVMRWTHALHHSYTLQTKNPYDYEIQIPRPSNLFRFYMSLVPFGQMLWIHESLISQTIKCSIGFIPKSVKDAVPEKHIWKIVLNSRIQITFYSMVIIFSIIFQTILPILYILLPYFYGNTFLFLVGYTQHAGLALNVKDPRINCRTIKLNPVLSWLYCRMEYHMEHHMYPRVPWYNLPKLHNELKEKLPLPNNGLISAYREIIPAVHKQAIDPHYVPHRFVPE